MYVDEELYKAFLEEMNSLEMFRMAYASLHESKILDSEDPDIKRLIEALAFFSAKAKLAGIKNIKAARQKIFKQFFSYLMTPIPAMGILYARTTPRLTEATFLPKGSEIAISSEDGKVAIFTTMAPLKILPFYLSSVDMLPLSNKGYRFLLEFYSPFPRSEALDNISLHINYLNNFEASLRILSLLKRCLIQVGISFDEKVEETEHIDKCKVIFGELPKEAGESEVLNPLEKERLFFRFPWQELFLTINIPKTSSSWTKFFIYLDVNSNWPRNLILGKDIFQLFAVPVINLRRFNSEPIICDGYKEKYLIRYPDREYGFELHSVKGVYEVTKEGLSPLLPEVLSGSRGVFDIEETSKKDASGVKLHYLRLDLPDAFNSPRTITIDGLWFQPWFSTVLGHKLKVYPFTRDLSGVHWDIHPDIVPHFRNPFLDDMEACLNLITLVHKEHLNKEDIVEILTALGIVKNNRFTRIYELIDDIRLQTTAYGSKGTGQLKYVYWLRFSEYDSSIKPLIELFAVHLQNILDAWIANAIVEVKIEGIDQET